MRLDRRTFALSFSVQYRRPMRAHPNIRVIVMANTESEQRLLRRLWVEPDYIPQNMFIDEGMSFPIAGSTRTFKAIYNAQPASLKRHKLARTIPDCAYIMKSFSALSLEHKRASVAEFMRDLPRRHVVLNEVTDGDVSLMSHLQVNQALSRAHMGLCLSRVEGAMYAGTEYLLAGLPVVSTRSAGGRDAFFHPDTSLIVGDTPRAVQDGVAAMKACNRSRAQYHARADQQAAGSVQRPDRRIARGVRIPVRVRAEIRKPASIRAGGRRERHDRQGVPAG